MLITLLALCSALPQSRAAALRPADVASGRSFPPRQADARGASVTPARAHSAAATGVLSGTLLGVDGGAPIEGTVTVFTQTADATDFVDIRSTNSDGVVVLDQLAPATYYLLAEAFGEPAEDRYLPTYYNGSATLAGAAPIAVSSGLTTSVQVSLSLRHVLTATPEQAAEALGLRASEVVSATSDGTDPRAIAIATRAVGRYMPLRGNSFVVLSTGYARFAEENNLVGNRGQALNGLNNSGDWDMARLVLTLQAPPTATCASFAFAFYSEEFPEFVGSQFNDVFTAELGGTDITISGNQVSAPRNFAFDTQNRIISINTVFGVQPNTETTYDGATPLIVAQTPVTPGAISTFVFTVQDLGDSSYDSAVFLDDFHWGASTEQCRAGSFVQPSVFIRLPIMMRQ